MTGLIFHHFGIAVKQPQEAIAFLTVLGYRLADPVFDSLQNVHLILGTHDIQPAVEIIYPGMGPGPIDNLVERHTSGIVYHLCYETADLEQSLRLLEKSGSRVLCIAPPKPAVLFHGRMASFYNVRGTGLIEVIE